MYLSIVPFILFFLIFTLPCLHSMNDFVQSEEISHSLTIDNTVENSKCLLNNVYLFI